jgi:alpha-glucosidase
VAAVLLLTLRGTPTIYYGEELGMHDVEIPPGRVVDVREINVPGRGLGRDPQRTPMQWDRSRSAGFTDGDPWLPLPADAGEHSVEAEQDDGGSMLTLYRALLALRRRDAALAVGSYVPLPASGSLLAYLREDAGRRIGIVLNLSSEPAMWTVPDGVHVGRLLLTARSGAATGGAASGEGARDRAATGAAASGGSARGARDVAAARSGEIEIAGDEALIFEA